jgi:hypothetical protein
MEDCAMNTEAIMQVLGWCGVINSGFLLYWYAMLVFAHDAIYKLHSKWFQLSIERFDAAHYALMGLFKLAILLFNIAPYLALRMIS